MFVKFVVVFVALIEISRSIDIELKEPPDFEQLGEAAINILLNCYVQQNKTMLLVGDYPGDFVQKLTSQISIPLVLLDNKIRSENINENVLIIDPFTKHKVDVVVIITSSVEDFYLKTRMYWHTVYDNPLASMLIIGWSVTDVHTGCSGVHPPRSEREALPLNILSISFMNNMPNTNLMCRTKSSEIMMHTYNPFKLEAPEAWRLFIRFDRRDGTSFAIYNREYREHKETCENLDFDKLQDLNGFSIKTTRAYHVNATAAKEKPDARLISNRRLRIQSHKRGDFIDNFIIHMNGTPDFAWKRKTMGVIYTYVPRTIDDTPYVMRGMKIFPAFTYPHATECTFLVTQFRGNLSQLEKIYAVIDSYSWIGMYLVYLITLIFFKLFLRQPVIVGILNLCRLTCNWGLPTIPPDLPPRMYIACLLFFVLTMHGIFEGNLASLLTHDFPVRQVDTLEYLAELGYTVYSDEFFSIYFNDTSFEGRYHSTKPYESCIPYVLRDRTTACAAAGAEWYDAALKADLHVSSDCVVTEYLHNRIPWRWLLQEKLNGFLLITAATFTVMPLDAIVDEKRLLEAESVEVLLEPEVMIWSDLSFAFIILGVGLGFATIVLTAELIIHQYRRNVTTSRVIVLSSSDN